MKQGSFASGWRTQSITRAHSSMVLHLRMSAQQQASEAPPQNGSRQATQAPRPNPPPRISKSSEKLPSKICSFPAKELQVLGRDGPFHRERTEPLGQTKVGKQKVELVNTPEGASMKDCIFRAHDPRFHTVIGDSPQVVRLAQKDYEFAHEGPVWLPELHKLFFVSNRLGNHETTDQRIQLWTLDPETLETQEIVPSTPILTANGATNWAPSKVLVEQQGHKQIGGALFALDVETGEAELLLDNWNGLRFNSPNDLAVCSCVVNGPSVFFTDPSCGIQQNFRTNAQLGEYVWRWDIRSGSVQVAADGFVQPNGVVLSPDGKVAYITDTGLFRPDVRTSPHTIYAFDIVRAEDSSFLTNRRVFAAADCGIPDGIKVDEAGNIWTGTGEGVAVYSPGGKLLGKIAVGEVSNLVFAGDVLVMLREKEVLAAKLAVRGPALPGMFEQVA